MYLSLWACPHLSLRNVSQSCTFLFRNTINAEHFSFLNTKNAVHFFFKILSAAYFSFKMRKCCTYYFLNVASRTAFGKLLLKIGFSSLCLQLFKKLLCSYCSILQFWREVCCTFRILQEECRSPFIEKRNVEHSLHLEREMCSTRTLKEKGAALVFWKRNVQHSSCFKLRIVQHSYYLKEKCAAIGVF